MERIKINSIEKKGVVCIVKYLEVERDGAKVGLQEANLNINFNKQEIYYLTDEVGIGGTVSIEITNKEKVEGNPSAGFWVNITKVDFSSAEKGEVELIGREEILEGQAVTLAKAGLMSAKDISIVSQVLLKAAFYAKGGTPQEVLDAYRFFVLELEQNG